MHLITSSSLGSSEFAMEHLLGWKWRRSKYLTSISRLCRISLLWPSIMWSPESTTRSGWNSSKLDTNTSSIFKAPFDRSWEKIKRLALGAFTCPHSSPRAKQRGANQLRREANQTTYLQIILGYPAGIWRHGFIPWLHPINSYWQQNYTPRSA